jgi:sensor histidine kinase regulating citrate/malate metabolism
VTIIGNALDNAFEALTEMPDDRRRVDVSIYRAGSAVEIVIRDWGPGLPEWMTDPFVRGTSAKPGHSGLGLLLAREAAIAAYGDMRVENLGDGTRVVARVPIIAPVDPVRTARLAMRSVVPRDRS